MLSLRPLSIRSTTLGTTEDRASIRRSGHDPRYVAVNDGHWVGRATKVSKRKVAGVQNIFIKRLDVGLESVK